MADMATTAPSRRRSTLRRLLAAAAVLALAWWVWQARKPVQLDQPQAQARAEQMLGAYMARSGEPPAHFAAMAGIEYPEGWEFSWAYTPCPEVARLSIFIRRSGSGHYGELPDCHPTRGFGAAPQAV
jgi:hypothetical protein